ncbi:MAG: CHAT domain-containing protein [Crocinitomicaceae bacterium]|nr:CHAT domain-containing protein [Crocinitomicaceae bacterium]
MRFFTIVILFNFSILSRAQDIRDSLWKMIEVTQDDSVRTSCYMTLIGQYIYFDADSSRLMCEKTISMSEQYNLSTIKPEAYAWMAYIVELNGELDLFKYYSEKALICYRSIGHKVGEAIVLSNLGLYYLRIGNYTESIRKFEASINKSIEVGDSTNIGITYSNISYLYYLQGNLDAAIQAGIKSIELNRIYGNPHTVSISLSNVGAMYNKQKRFDEAIVYFREALLIQETLFDTISMTGTLTNLGELYQLTNKIDSAVSCYNNVLLFCKDGNAPDVKISALSHLTRIYVDFGNLDSANYFAEQHLELAEDLHYADHLVKAYKLSNSVDMRMADSTQVLQRLEKVIAINNLAMEINFNLLTEAEKELYFQTLAYDYELYFSALIHLDQYTDSASIHFYNTVLMNKGFLLKSVSEFRNRILASGDSILIKDYADWTSIQKEMAEQKNILLIDSLKKEANSLEKKMAMHELDGTDYYSSGATNFVDVMNKLNPGEAAIEFVAFKDWYSDEDAGEIRYFALVILNGSNRPLLISLCSGIELGEVLGKYPGNNLEYINSIYGTDEMLQADLYKLIWQPIESVLTGIKTIYFSPAGLLHKVSFAAMRAADGEYLSAKFSLIQLSSTAQIADMKNPQIDKHNNLLMFGGIQFIGKNKQQEVWAYLPGSLSEINTITELSNNKKISAKHYSGDRATETNFTVEAPEFELVHIATHGFFYPLIVNFETDTSLSSQQKPEFRGASYQHAYGQFVVNENPLMRSGLVFANGNDCWLNTDSAGSDGVLTAFEVSNLNLRKNKLMVLSACETGLGDIDETEGVYGLQRAFKIAGSDFLIMSLWQVPDAETVVFMELFYTHLFKHHHIVDAFQHAQHGMQQKYDPYYWAAFVLIQ